MRPLLLRAGLLCLVPSLALAFSGEEFDGNAVDPLVFDADVPTAEHSETTLIERYWVAVSAPDRETRSLVASLGVSIEEIIPGKIFGVAPPETVDDLRRLDLLLSATPLRRHVSAQDFPTRDAAYHNYEEMTSALSAIADSAPGLVSKFSIGKSIHGRDLWALRINSDASGLTPSDKPGIVFLGTHHAREHLSTEVPLRLAKYLVENRTKENIAPLLASRDIYFIPMVNPDGVEYDLEGDRYHMQRKNLRRNADGSTGVDLNRNYGFHWGEGGASTNPRSDTYRGTAPFSEPESRAVKSFVEGHPNLTILLSYHSFSELILYPWGHKYDPLEDKQALAAYKAMAGEMGRMTGYTPEQSSDLYIASGDTTDWSWGAHKIFSFTFELTPRSIWSGGFYPGPAAIAKAFNNNIRPALYLIDLADDPQRAARVSISSTKIKITSGGR